MKIIKNNGHEDVFKNKVKHLGKYMNLKLNVPNFKEVHGQIYKLCTKCKKYYPMTEEFFIKRDNVKCKFSSHCKNCLKEKEKSRVRIKSYNDEGLLYCHTCKTYKPESEFNKGGDYKCRNNYSRECKCCESLRKQIQRANLQKDNPDAYFKKLVYGCRTRSRKFGVKCTLTQKDLLDLYEAQGKKCYFSGLTMTTILRSGKNICNASIDRIQPGGDYTKENIRLVCSQINAMRSNLSDTEFINLCKHVVNNELS